MTQQYKIVPQYKVVALFGKAGAGKDYLQKKIIQTSFGKEYLSEIISCTTRPPREGEIDGVHYHFIPTIAEFFNRPTDSWLECACFRNWWYGTSIDNLDVNKINVGVFNIQGIESLLKDSRVDLLPIYIHAYDKIRLLRQLNREGDPDCREICRRFNTDEHDFLNILFHYYVVENNTCEAQPAINDILNLIIEKFNLHEVKIK